MTMLLSLILELFKSLVPVVEEAGELRVSTEALAAMLTAAFAIAHFFGLDLGLDPLQLAELAAAVLAFIYAQRRKRESKP